MHRALIVLDGLADRPHPETGGLSPVEAAKTPNLDRMAREGRMGSVVLIRPGVAPESDAGVLALLGIDPEKESPGRGVLEALGIGIDLSPGDVAIRLNFATADGDGRILDPRVGRSLSTREASELARALTDAHLLEGEGVKAEVRATVGHRGVLWLHPAGGEPLSPEISNSDPYYEKVGGLGRARAVSDPVPLPVRPLSESVGAARTARLVELFLARSGAVLVGSVVNAKRALGGKPIANALLLRHAGSLPTTVTRSFRERTGLDGVAVTEMPVERGIARWLGLSDRFVGPMGADRDAALRERARLTRAELATHDLVYVHLKGPDEPGHDGRANAKKEVVEALDRSFFGPFLDGLDLKDSIVIVTADHATPCVLKAHSDDPVPLLLFGNGVEPDRPNDRTLKFSERAGASGSIGTVRGIEVLGLLGRGPAAPP